MISKGVPRVVNNSYLWMDVVHVLSGCQLSHSLVSRTHAEAELVSEKVTNELNVGREHS